MFLHLEMNPSLVLDVWKSMFLQLHFPEAQGWESLLHIAKMKNFRSMDWSEVIEKI